MTRFAGVWLVMAGLVATTAAPSFACAQPPPSAQTTMLVEPPAPLLPKNDNLVQNDAAAAVPADKPETAAILAESGLKRTETRAVMESAPPVPSGWVRAYQFVDASGAFAAYSYFKQGGKPVVSGLKNPTETMLPDGELVLLSGVSVVRAHINMHGDAASAVLATVNTGLPKIGGPRGLPPLLPKMLPTSGLNQASLRYALGPAQYQALGGQLPAGILGWDKSAEVATASYAGISGNGTLTLFLYPTPEIAADRGHAIQDAVNQRGPSSFGTVKLRRLGPLVEMTSGEFTRAQAQTLVDAVQLNQQVIFDKAMPSEFQTEIHKTATLLESIAIFTGVGTLAAVVLGVFLGGARAGIRVLQGKPAASEPEFLRIDLRGRPEPLQTTAGNKNEPDGC